MLDAIIVGGSNAGLSAALTLGRAMRHVIVFDDGKPCNRFSHASHGFLTRDGVAPEELRKIAIEQLARYETVKIQPVTVTDITPAETGFTVTDANGDQYTAKKILLATGLKDELPNLPNIHDYWGTSAFHCPYCDGWEVRNQPLVVYGSSAMAWHQTVIVNHWTDNMTLILGEDVALSAEEEALAHKHNIRLITTPVKALDGENGKLSQIILADDTAIPCTALFIQPKLSPRTPFGEKLGCEANEQGLLKIDTLGRTSVKGVYAAGDISSPFRNVSVAVAQGTYAGSGINADLVMEEFV